MKHCKKCDLEKAIEEFSRNKRNRDGLQSWCKACMAIERDKWNAQNSERRRELNRKWNEENPDKSRAKSLAWRNRNIERARSNASNWKKKNPERNAGYEQKRRAIKKMAEIGHFPTLLELIEVYGAACMYPECKNENLTVDHIIPLAVGGAHCADNAQILCLFHNSQKGHRNSFDYRPREEKDGSLS